MLSAEINYINHDEGVPSFDFWSSFYIAWVGYDVNSISTQTNVLNAFPYLSV